MTNDNIKKEERKSKSTSNVLMPQKMMSRHLTLDCIFKICLMHEYEISLAEWYSMENENTIVHILSKVIYCIPNTSFLYPQVNFEIILNCNFFNFLFLKYWCPGLLGWQRNYYLLTNGTSYKYTQKKLQSLTPRFDKKIGEVKLFATNRSLFSARIHSTLNLKSVELEFIKEDPRNKSSLLLQSNTCL